MKTLTHILMLAFGLTMTFPASANDHFEELDHRLQPVMEESLQIAIETYGEDALVGEHWMEDVVDVEEYEHTLGCIYLRMAQCGLNPRPPIAEECVDYIGEQDPCEHMHMNWLPTVMGIGGWYATCYWTKVANGADMLDAGTACGGFWF